MGTPQDIAGMATVPNARLLFGSELMPELLELLLRSPRRRFGWSDLHRELASPNPESLYRALNRAVELGVVRREAKGRYGLYSANPDSPLYADLKRLLANLRVRRPVGSYTPATLAEVGEELAARRWPAGVPLPADMGRVLDQFTDDFRGSRRRDKPRLIATPPDPTGHRRLDAYLAGLAEYLANDAGLPVPPWVEDPGRFLETWWIQADVPAARSTALAQSPAAFRRRGIFLSERALARV